MAYRIDASAIQAEGQAFRHEWEATIVLVGCGGTGGLLAEAVCRLLIGRKSQLFLVDMDRVEPHNVARQAFDRSEVGYFKAEVLARRLSRRFGREIGYSVLPYDRELHAQVFANSRSRLNLLLGCVDNAAARRAIAETLGSPIGGCGYPRAAGSIWWLDCGNGRNSGQILLGNVTRPEELRGALVPQSGLCIALPAPSIQRPDLLDAPPAPHPRLDCAEAVARGDQGPTINHVVAAIAASFVEKLLTGTCAWMASYFDLDDGALRCVAADPKIVAGIADLHVNAVAPPLEDRLTRTHCDICRQPRPAEGKMCSMQRSALPTMLRSDQQVPVESAGLPVLQAGGFSASVDAFAWEPDPDPPARRMRLWFLSLLGPQESVKALWARLVKGETATLSFEGLGDAHFCALAPEGPRAWRFYTANLRVAAVYHAVLVPEAALYGGDRPDFLLLVRHPEEAPMLHYRFLNRRLDLPLHPTWAAWLWDRALRVGEAVSLESQGLRAYRCIPNPEQLAEDITSAVRRGTLSVVVEVSQ